MPGSESLAILIKLGFKVYQIQVNNLLGWIRSTVPRAHCSVNWGIPVPLTFLAERPVTYSACGTHTASVSSESRRCRGYGDGGALLPGTKMPHVRFANIRVAS